MGKFKVGDRVKRIEASEWPEQYGEVGKEYTVLDVSPSGRPTVIDGSNGAMRHAFELVSPVWVPKVGDRVVNESGDAEYVGATGVIDLDDCSSFRRYRIALDVPTPVYGDKTIWRGVSEMKLLPAVSAPATLTIEPGKFYKTRDGRKVGPAVYGATGAFADEGFVWRVGVRSFRADGSVGWCEDHDDLIAEWQEPAATGAVVQSAQVDALAEEYGPAKVASVAASNDNAPKFKVGDKVKFRDDYGSTPHAGKRATVLGVNQWGNDGIKVDTGVGPYSISTERAASLELLPPSTPSIVALIENGTPKPSATPKVHPDQGDATAEAQRLANLHKGQEFGVFVYATSTTVAKPVYEHKWQNLAADGQKINAIKALKDLTGLQLKPAKDAVEYFLEHAA